MNEAITTQWHQILSLTDSLLVAANHNEWGRLEELEAQRRKLIYDFFQRNPNAKQSNTVSEDIAFILAQDRKVAKLAVEFQTELIRNLGLLKENRRAVEAYGK